MKKLLLITAALAFVATPVMAEHAIPGARSSGSFGGPYETHAGGRYPRSQFVAGDMDADSGHATEHDVTSSTHAHVAVGDMDSDSSQFNNG